MFFKKIYNRINHLIFCPESKQMIRDVGNIELCELLETEPKTRCKVCLSYWNICNLYFTCGQFLHKERGRTSNSSFLRWTFFQFWSTSSRKDDFTDIDLVKRPGDKEYHTANQLKKKCKKKYFQGIHDRFIRDPEFRRRMIEKIETKNFAENGMLLRMKIIPTIRPTKILSTRVVGGFIRTINAEF